MLGWNEFAAECAERIKTILKFRLPKARFLLDFACGTGELEYRLRNAGISPIGVDISPAMLKVARKKNPGVEFIVGDMISLKLERKFDIVCCFFDSVNHLRSTDELNRFFGNVAVHLRPGGLFVFDTLSPAGLAKWEFFDLKTAPDYTVITSGDFDENKIKARITIEGFVRRKSGLYRRFRQEIVEKAFAFKTILRSLQKAGFSHIAVSSFDPAESIEKSSRWFLLARSTR